jgi:carboxypeptidase Taq
MLVNICRSTSIHSTRSGYSRLGSTRILGRCPVTHTKRPFTATSSMAPAAVVESQSTPVKEDYEKLATKLRDISALSGISGLLGWDEMVMMPPGAAASRSRQKAALAGVLHEKSVDPELGALLQRLEVEDDGSLSDWEAACVREAVKQYRKDTCITEDFVRRESAQESKGYAAWVKAREEDNFAGFAPVLREWVELKKERAAMVDSSKNPYDVLADDFSAGLTSARVTEIFDQVKAELIPFLAELREKGTAPDNSWLVDGDFDVEKQTELCFDIAKDIGFDLDRGLLNVSVHPFTGGCGPEDVRMTTRYKKNDVTEGLTGAIHETGHALYEQGRNMEGYAADLPVNSAAGMAIHESQSLLWERMVALSEPFAEYLLPKLQEKFGDAIGSRSSQDLYRALNVVKMNNLIRVESDEVTYPMHIILRFDIEKALIEGTLQVEDVPRVWNEKMKEYLGVNVTGDAKGVLQDIHWCGMGAFAYFPTYTLGAMAATQIFETAKEQIPDLDDKIRAGNFKPLKEWLNENVHALGSLYPTADDLLVKVTGKPLDPTIFVRYLKEKYTKIYNLP